MSDKRDRFFGRGGSERLQIDRLQGTKLQELIVGDNRDANTRKRNDEPTRIKNNLNPKNIKGTPKGTIGLAQAVYRACQL